MQAVEQHPYVDQVLLPLAGESAMGMALGEDPTLEFLDNEVMKVGSLAHTGIEWSRVERDALQLLADRSKDLKVLGFLLLCLQRGGNGERFALSLYLLHRVLDSWWADAWPYPGDKGKRPRRLLFGQMMQRAARDIDSLRFDGGVGDGRQFCLELLAKLIQQVAALGIPDDGLVGLQRSIERLPAAGQTEEPAPEAGVTANTSKPDNPDGAVNTPASTRPAATLGNVSFDPGNERATRQSLLKVADLLTEVSPADPLGYQLRRYAIWQSISATPPTRDGARTDLAAVSADRVADYRDALARGAELALWQRIEQSLSVSPFWLEGHWLSAEAAEELGHSDCAEAIRTGLKAFVDRLPALADMTFNDGTPFLPAPVAEWLHATPTLTASDGSGQPWEQAYQQACEQLEQQGLATAMQTLDDGLAEAREPRDRFYWRLMSVELLRRAGLGALAQQQAGDLRGQVRELPMEQWEPGLIARLERLG